MDKQKVLTELVMREDQIRLSNKLIRYTKEIKGNTVLRYLNLLVESAWEMSNDPSCDWEVSIHFTGGVNCVTVMASGKRSESDDWRVYKTVWLNNENASEELLDALSEVRQLLTEVEGV